MRVERENLVPSFAMTLSYALEPSPARIRTFLSYNVIAMTTSYNNAARKNDDNVIRRQTVYLRNVVRPAGDKKASYMLSCRMTEEEGKLLERVVEHEEKRLGPGYNVSASSVLRRLLWEHASQLGFDDLPEPPGVDAQKSVVYFLQSTGPSGVIKIGTTMHLTARIAAVQRDHPVPVKLVLTLPGSFKAERGYHLMFAHLRFEGEWFFPEPDLVGFIQAERAKQEAAYDEATKSSPGKPGILDMRGVPGVIRKMEPVREVSRDQPAPNGLADEDLDALLKE